MNDIGGEFILKIHPMTNKNLEKIYLEREMPTGVIEPSVYAVFDDKVYII